MQLEAFLYDGQTSKRTRCVLEIGMDGRFQLPNGLSWNWQQLNVSKRIGHSARFLDLPDGSRLETGDNDLVDQLCTQFGQGDDKLHILESRTRYVLASIILTALAGWWFIASGIPLIANHVAHVLPAGVTQELGNETLSFLDEILFHESQLDASQQTDIRSQFQALASQQHSDFRYKLHFRDGGGMANAFALPSGDIVITDQLIALAEHPDAVIGVLAHEIGHVEYRHIIRRILQDSVLPLVITAVTGDATVATTVLAGLPTLMVEAHYSREFESEADQFAIQQLQANGRNPAHLAALLSQLEAHMHPDGETEAEEKSSIGSWFSSHPGTEERIRILRESEASAR